MVGKAVDKHPAPHGLRTLIPVPNCEGHVWVISPQANWTAMRQRYEHWRQLIDQCLTYRSRQLKARESDGKVSRSCWMMAGEPASPRGVWRECSSGMGYCQADDHAGRSGLF